MYFYVAHGLRLASELPIPGLVETTAGRSDVLVTLHRGKLDIPSEVIASGPDFCITNEGTFIFEEGVFTLLVRGGREMIIEPTQGVDTAELAAYVKGDLGVVLSQRNRLVMHASGVAINGGSVVFVGDGGTGKSTLALALYTKGHEFIGDDVISVSFEDDQPLAIPAYPEVKASERTLAALSYDTGAFQRSMFTSERWVPITDRFCERAIPLRNLYTLVEGDATTIEPIPPHVAFVELVKHSRQAESSQGVSIHLDRCAMLVRTMSIRRLTVYRSSESIVEVARLVEEDVTEAEQ